MTTFKLWPALLFMGTTFLFSESKVVQKQIANRLANETSPYLLQHAYNPIQWYPWGEEALAKAKKENKPIFLSVGYSACHWCHVMAHESFEDEEIAKVLNEHYISIKVDREERPDIDDIYMSAVQSMTGSGGWPMTVFMTPDEAPFYAGTYFPKENKYGKPGFLSIVQQLHDAWKRDEVKIREVGGKIVNELNLQLSSSIPATDITETLLFDTLSRVIQDADKKNGGFGGSPKFPSSMSLQLIIDGLKDLGDSNFKDELSTHLKLSLRKMAEGGMYDQIGGGFHRYSTDAKWLVPHFEKMLYDNALLATCYFEAAELIDHDFNLRIGKEICDYVIKEMLHESGAFFSTTDADSEGMEGKFFLWDKNELSKVLGEKSAGIFSDIFEIDAEPMGDVKFDGGTPPHDWFHGRTAHLTLPLEDYLSKYKLNLSQVNEWKLMLWNQREKRVPPGKDTKVLSSWNGLMSLAFCKAYQTTGESKYLEVASKNLNFVWTEMQSKGRLFATWKDGDARHFGTLEDYSNMADAYLYHFKVSGSIDSLERAKILADSVMQFFDDGKGKAFFYTAHDAEKLIVRSKNPYDNAVPSGNSVLAGVLFRLFLITGEEKYRVASEGIIHEYSTYIVKAPMSFPRLGRETIFQTKGVKEYVLLGANENLRNKVCRAMTHGDVLLTESGKGLALAKGKVSLKNQATLYICKLGQCLQPIVGESEILSLLKKN